MTFCFCFFDFGHELQTPCEEIAFTEWPKIHSYSQICRCGQSIFCLSHRPKFSDFFNLYLHWVSIVCDFGYWNTVFPPIVSLETTVFWKWRMWKFSYSFCIMAIFYFINQIVATETIQRGKLFKGGNYLRKYGIH